MKKLTDVKFVIIFLLCLLSISFAYKKTLFNKAYIQISLTSSTDSILKLYWSESNQKYSEDKSAEIDIYKRTRTYIIYFENLKKIGKIRIDPINQKGIVTIHSIIIRQEEYEPIYLIEKNCFSLLKPSGTIEKTENIEEGLKIISNGKDPQLNLELGKTKVTNAIDIEIFRFIIAIIISWIIASIIRSNNFSNRSSITESHFAIILSLTILMAIMSRYNLHPDEAVHFEAAKYYENNWVPPRVCDPSIQYTYSRYGVSRLDTHEIAYWIAGKANSILRLSFMEPYLRYRIFNILLLVGIIISALKEKKNLYFLFPFIISPQIWYVYSYYSSDSFALTLGILITYELINRNSFLKSTIKTNNISFVFIIRSLICGITLAMYFFVKINYQILIIFWIGYVGLEIFNNPDLFERYKRGIFSIFISCAILIFTINLFYSYDNGVEKNEKILLCQEQIAENAFKPDTPYNKQYPTLNIKAKGLPLSYVTENKHWGGRIFSSSFGVYGHTSIIAFPFYYSVVKYLLILLISYIFIRILYSWEKKEIIFIVGVMLCSIILIGAALYHSWTVDIQAQGRYLFPLIPMYGAIIYKSNYFENDMLFTILINSMFVISIYSFLFVGLFNMVLRNSLPF